VALQKRKSDEAESKHVGLAQQNGFAPAFLHRRIWRLGNSTAKLNTAVDLLDSLIGRVGCY
jgi:hypothetical protein